MNRQKITINVLRYVMSFVFLWAFVDKVFGLNFSTKSADAWIHGGSPTHGFLAFGTHGPFINVFHLLATYSHVIDWVFMLGLLFIGLTLVFNKYVKWGCLAGCVMLFFMYLSLLLPANNPVIDEHIVYILILMLIAFNSEEKAII